jgi:hypothetical protein
MERRTTEKENSTRRTHGTPRAAPERILGIQIIPAANVRHLILREDVISAVADGSFTSIRYAPSDRLSILTGFATAFVARADTLNSRVAARLKQLSCRTQGVRRIRPQRRGRREVIESETVLKVRSLSGHKSIVYVRFMGRNVTAVTRVTNT